MATSLHFSYFLNKIFTETVQEKNGLKQQLLLDKNDHLIKENQNLSEEVAFLKVKKF